MTARRPVVVAFDVGGVLSKYPAAVAILHALDAARALSYERALATLFPFVDVARLVGAEDPVLWATSCQVAREALERQQAGRSS